MPVRVYRARTTWTCQGCLQRIPAGQLVICGRSGARWHPACYARICRQDEDGR